jgi:hypothetical protein
MSPVDVAPPFSAPRSSSAAWHSALPEEQRACTQTRRRGAETTETAAGSGPMQLLATRASRARRGDMPSLEDPDWHQQTAQANYEHLVRTMTRGTPLTSKSKHASAHQCLRDRWHVIAKLFELEDIRVLPRLRRQTTA